MMATLLMDEALRCGAAGYFAPGGWRRRGRASVRRAARSLGDTSGSPSTSSSCFAGVVVVAAADRQRAERQPREAAIGAVSPGERGQRRRSRRLLARRSTRRSAARSRAASRNSGSTEASPAIASKGRDRAGGSVDALAPASVICGQDAVAAGRLGGDLGEAAERLVRLARVEGRDRRLELVARRLRGLFLLVLPVAEAGRREHDQHRPGDDEVLVFLPELRRLVAPDLLVDFLKDIRHFRIDASGAAPSARQIRARPNTRGGGKRAAPAAVGGRTAWPIGLGRVLGIERPIFSRRPLGVQP